MIETDLNSLWFLLITVLWLGYFFLEGFDFGVGILLPFVGRDDLDRRVAIRTIGPLWDGNEVWLLVAGGATFAAFPEWYATLFSGFYLPLFLILVALIVRGVAFEYRAKDRRPEWRAWWDRAIFFGSALPALLWGVAFGNIVRGVPIDAVRVHRRVLEPAEALRPARRTDHAAPVHPARRHLPEPEGGGAGGRQGAPLRLAAGPAHGGGGRRVPRLDPGRGRRREPGQHRDGGVDPGGRGGRRRCPGHRGPAAGQA